MKKWWLVLLMTLGMAFAADVVWQKDFDSAMKIAKKEHRMVMVFVEGEHCRWCKKMRYRTLSDALVVKKLAAFVNVRVDRTDRKVMSKLPQIEGVPTIFFLSSEGKIVRKVTGYYPAGDFLSFLYAF